MKSLLVALVVLSASAAAQVAVEFERTNYLAGTKPVSVVLGDLNGDGAPDMAYAAEESGEIFVRLNRGGGFFEAAQLVGTMDRVVRVALGEIDGDGVLDLVALSDEADRLVFYRGLGDGSFAAAGGFALPSEFQVYVTLADLNGDGFDEFLVTEGYGAISGHVLTVGVNVGGVYAQTLLLDTKEGAPTLAVGDLNQDGWTDIVTGSYGGGDGDIFLGGPNLTFAPPVDFPRAFGGPPEWIDLADFDGDGVLDACSAENDGYCKDVVIWKGNGDGTFGPESVWETFSVYPDLLTAGDFNGDGDLDIAARWNGGLGVYGGNGTGVFSTLGATEKAGFIRSVAVADLDGDRRDDIVTANSTSHRISVFLSRPEEATAYAFNWHALHEGISGHKLAIQLGPEYAGHLYWVLGSLSGAKPGVDLGDLHLPLKPDGYTNITIAQQAPIVNQVGVLNAAGAGNASLLMKWGTLGGPLKGTKLFHAFLVFDPVSLELEYVSGVLKGTVKQHFSGP